MGQIFTLTDGVKGVIQTALDDLITELGKLCRIVYPPRFINCPNCIFDPTTNKSSNNYKSGGEFPFNNGGICPLCNGLGKQSTQQTEDIKLLASFEPKTFVFPIKTENFRSPFSIVQIKGYLADVPKIKKMDHLVFQTGIEQILRKKYRLYGEPSDVSNIIQNRYFIAKLEEID